MLVLIYHTLPETNMALENRPSQKERIVSQLSIFRDELLVSGRVNIYPRNQPSYSQMIGVSRQMIHHLCQPPRIHITWRCLKVLFISSKGVMKLSHETDPWSERYIYLSMNGLIGMVNVGTYTVPFVPWIRNGYPHHSCREITPKSLDICGAWLRSSVHTRAEISWQNNTKHIHLIGCFQK